MRIPISKLGSVRTVVVCKICGDPFQVAKNLAHRYSTCSRECMSENRKVPKIDLSCEWCENTFSILPGNIRSTRKFCSNPCRMLALNALDRVTRDPDLNVRTITDKGYVRIYDGKRLVMEHRYVMSKVIGRELTPEERVHHLDGERSNNNPDNLVLCVNQRDHLLKYHTESMLINLEKARAKKRE